jgi:hypothetical protein
MLRPVRRRESGGFLQRPVDRPGAREQAAVERVEPLVRRKEFEAAGNAHGDPDRATVELNGKSLPGGHGNVSPGERILGRETRKRLSRPPPLAYLKT